MRYDPHDDLERHEGDDEHERDGQVAAIGVGADGVGVAGVIVTVRVIVAVIVGVRKAHAVARSYTWQPAEARVDDAAARGPIPATFQSSEVARRQGIAVYERLREVPGRESLPEPGDDC
jgi:hypothetical protein